MSWNRPNLEQHGTKCNFKSAKASTATALAFAVLVCVSLAIGIVVWCTGFRAEHQGNVVEDTYKPTPIREVEAAKIEVVQLVREDPAMAERNRKRKERADMLRSMTPEERIDFLWEEAKRNPINLDPASNRVFATATEQVMAWIFTTKVGDVPPPLPRLPIKDEAHLVEILFNNVPVKDGDSAKTAYAKENVQLAKDELKKFIKEGGSPNEFFEYYHGQLVDAHREWNESRKEAMRVCREDPMIARDYIRAINSRLEKKGIKPVTIAPGYLTKYGVPEEDEE